jgi:glucose/arabinose dehydrogenase
VDSLKRHGGFSAHEASLERLYVENSETSSFSLFLEDISMTRQQIASLLAALFLLAAAVISLHASEAITAAPSVSLQPFVSGLVNPVDLQSAKDGSGRLFAVEQRGKIRVITGGRVLTTSFLNVVSIVESGGEKGLLGLAFHPSYKTNGRFFVNYTRRINGQLKTFIVEYHVSKSNPNIADVTSRKIILTVNQPFDNHNGGQLAFGADGYLYIGLGDGGSAGDPLNNAQNRATLLGKILRININSASPYAIPPDNPFVGQSGRRGEIWAYGFRNPWRFSFDLSTKRLFVADVGQDNWEEVDVVTKGANYGWRIMEGNHCYPPGSSCNPSGLTLPIHDYSHSLGESIIGGYVYRGSKISGLAGQYVFGDFIGGQIWRLQQISPGVWQRNLLLSTGFLISAFGRDAAGELYVLDYGGGTIYKLI